MAKAEALPAWSNPQDGCGGCFAALAAGVRIDSMSTTAWRRQHGGNLWFYEVHSQI